MVWGWGRGRETGMGERGSKREEAVLESCREAVGCLYVSS